VLVDGLIDISGHLVYPVLDGHREDIQAVIMGQ